ncbi:hypothetical protein F5Y14DRAFT_413781 [Nemania sp. NC0429]|nr:hypothetical protein F5Y14DRAFT_413781 [Nemania sp. NC0429]
MATLPEQNLELYIPSTTKTHVAQIAPHLSSYHTKLESKKKADNLKLSAPIVDVCNISLNEYHSGVFNAC